MSWLKPAGAAPPSPSSSSIDDEELHGDSDVGGDPRVSGAGGGGNGRGAAPLFSIIEALRGRSVLITGGTGYLGGVVLEQLLRVAGHAVGNIYILARSRAGKGARERVGRVLGSGLFTEVRSKHAEALKKVVALDGDLLLSGLGLSAAALAELAAEPSLVIVHSAARIALEDPIQDTLINNYEGTRRLLGMVETRLPNCTGFVHVSTTFVGMNQPHNSTVPERLCPLMFGDQRVDHARLARELLAADKKMADSRAALLCRNWGLPNTYLLGKHLSEALVEQYHSERRIPAGCCIVRPSLVSAVAGAPYPGYVGNLAGPSGYMTAFALGFFNKGSPAWHAWHLLDSVPGDVAGGVIIGAAATLAAGIHSREQLHALAAEAAAAGAAAARSAAAAAAGNGPGGAGGGRGGIVVARGTGTVAAEVAAAAAALAAEPSGAFLEGGNESFSVRDLQYDESKGNHWNRRALAAAAALDAAAKAVEGEREAAAAAREAGEMLVFHAATSTVNPCMHWEAYEFAMRFFSRHTPKWRLGRYVTADEDYRPVPWRVTLAVRITAAKVAMSSSLLSCFGQARAARKLRTGFMAWSGANVVKHDKTLFFSIRNVLALERCVPAEERALLPLVWRGNWVPFGNTYMAAVCKLFMGLPVPPSTPELPHTFTYLPFVNIREEDLPRLAGAGAGSSNTAGGGGGGRVPASAAGAAAAAAAAGGAAAQGEAVKGGGGGGGSNSAKKGQGLAAAMEKEVTGAGAQQQPRQQQVQMAGV